VIEMTVAQTTMKEELYRRILDLPDEAIAQVSRYVNDFEAHEPNEETIAVLKDMEAGRNLAGPFYSLKEMFQDFGIDVNP
jgi:hypothetical protein